MSRVVLTVVLAALVLPAHGAAAQGADKAEEQKIMSTLALLSRAMIDKDLPTLQRLLHDGMSYGHSGGLVQTKAQVLEVTRTRGVDRWTFKNARVTVANGTALVRANIVFSEAVDGYRNDTATDAAPNVLLVLVKGRGPQGWQVLGRQNFVGLLRAPAAR